MKYKYLIIGSGIGGISAAAELKAEGEEDFRVIDRVPSLPLNLHNGVHYLHTDDFGTPFKFELKEITSTEEVWNPRKDEFKKTAHLPEMIDYSLKVMNLRHPSSIMDPGSRPWKTYIPLSNNMNDLIQSYHDYIGAEKFEWGAKLSSVDTEHKIAVFEKEGAFFTVEYEVMITTVPMKVCGELCQIEIDNEFKSQTIYVTNYKTTKIVPNWLISLYISDDEFPAYRITVLNNIISLESLRPMTIADEHILKYHLQRYFDYELESKESYAWDTGRIWGLTKDEREEAVRKFVEKDIYPLGRFGLWNGKLTMDTTILQARKIVYHLKGYIDKNSIINNLKG